MKRLIFAVLAIMVMAAPMANAQKVNKEAVLAKLEKADADVANPKKGTKAATWMARGKAYYDAAVAPTKDIFNGMELSVAQLAIGKPEATNEGVVLNGQKYTELVYPWMKVYVAGGKIVTWVVTQSVKEGDLAMEALNSYNKAFELDPKQAPKIAEALKFIENYYSQGGNAAMDAGLFSRAAELYNCGYTVQESPAYAGQKNSDYLYFAGYLWTVDGANNKASFVKGAEALNKALANGYTDKEGNIYYYLYHAYYGQTDSAVREANMQRAKQLLMEGLSKFPNNDRIIEGLINVYTSSDSNSDPKELLEMVNNALQRDPKNKDMWFGRGRIYYSLKNYDESITSFKRVIALDPNDALATFYVGFFYIAKGDALNEEINQRDYKSNAEWKADQEKVTNIYRESVPYLEKAHTLNPKDFSTIETLKILTFRLRDDEGMMPKYEKYNKLYEEMKAQQNK